MSKEKSFVFWADTPEEKALWAGKFDAAEKSRAQIKNITLGNNGMLLPIASQKTKKCSLLL